MNIFNQTFTKNEQFFDTNGNPLGNVNMMFQRGPFAYSAVGDLGCHILELPYATVGDGGSSLSMVLVLPRKGLSLEEAIMKVHQFGMERMYKEFAISKAEYEDDEVEVHIPRFEIETSLDIKDTLEGVRTNLVWFLSNIFTIF
jgi:serine protease inhibitor